jgi:hypothetical protein
MAVDLFPLFYSREALRRCHWVGPELLVIGLKYIFDLFIFLFSFSSSQWYRGFFALLGCIGMCICTLLFLASQMQHSSDLCYRFDSNEGQAF